MATHLLERNQEMKINSVLRLSASQEDYLSLKFYHAVKYWIYPTGQLWEDRLKAYSTIVKAGVPKEYKEGGTFYRGITLSVVDYLKLKGNYTFDKPTSWTKHEIPAKSEGIGWAKYTTRALHRVKHLEDIPDTHLKYARVYIVFKKTIPSSQVVLDIDSLFLNPEYKKRVKDKKSKN